MRLLLSICSVLVVQVVALGQISLRGMPSVQDAFGGKPNELPIAISNKSSERTSVKLSYRLFQLNSSTAAPVDGVKEWKTLELLPEQTVLDRISIELPSVRAATAFRLQVLSADSTAVGSAIVRAIPEKPLAAINKLAGGSKVGVVSVNDELVNAFRALGMECEVVSPDTISAYVGPLLIVDAFHTTSTESGRSRYALDNVTTGTVILSRAPADDLDRLKLISNHEKVRTELALQACDIPLSAAFAWRLIEAAEVTIKEGRK